MGGNWKHSARSCMPPPPFPPHTQTHRGLECVCNGERPIGAAKGKQTNTMASCQCPPPPPHKLGQANIGGSTGTVAQQKPGRNVENLLMNNGWKCLWRGHPVQPTDQLIPPPPPHTHKAELDIGEKCVVEGIQSSLRPSVVLRLPLPPHQASLTRN